MLSDKLVKSIAMMLQMTAVCFILMLLNSPASSRPLHRSLMKRQTEASDGTSTETIMMAIYSATKRTYVEVKNICNLHA